MKRPTTLVLALCAVAVILPNAAVASSYVTNHKVITQDCSKDPMANIGSEDSEYTFTGTCKAVNLEGNNNKVHIASAKALILNGNHNQVDVEAIDVIFITGARNEVTWKKGLSRDQPRITNTDSTSKVAQAK